MDEDIEYTGKQLDKDIVNKKPDTHHYKSGERKLAKDVPGSLFPPTGGGQRRPYLKSPKPSSSPKQILMQKTSLKLCVKNLAKKISSAKR